jgi:hypothetical protein
MLHLAPAVLGFSDRQNFGKRGKSRKVQPIVAENSAGYITRVIESKCDRSTKPKRRPQRRSNQGESLMKKLITSAVAAVVLGVTTFQASAYERWFNLVNDTGNAIVIVRVTNIDDPNFHGRNLLRGYVILPGGTMQIEPVNTNGYCRFDLELTFANGDRQTIWDVNLCEAIQVATRGEDGVTVV